MEIIEETRKSIEEGLSNWHDPNSEAKKRFEASREYWDKVFEPLTEAFIDSQMLTERNYNMRIIHRDYFK